MPLELILKKPLRPSIRNTLREATRNIYRFDGFDDYAVLAYRAINPDGDIDIEFYTPSFSGVKTVIYQGAGESDFNQCDFWLLRNGNNIEFRVGGMQRGIGILPANEKFRITLVGTALRVYNSRGEVVLSATFTRGTYRSSNPVTVIGARLSGSSYLNYFQGIQRDVKINGTLWRMADRNQAIQLPEPSGLGAELITSMVLENPAVKGSQWTYLGGGRWQYIGDGTPNTLRFISAFTQPSTGFLEFEVESISGVITCSQNNLARGRVDKVGVFRYFYTDKDEGGLEGSTVMFYRAFSGQAASCIIKNISFKPLSVVNSTELVANGDFSNGTTGWAATSTSSFTVTSGKASVGYVAGQNSRVTQLLVLEAGKYYEVTADVVSLTGVTSAILRVIRGSEGGFADVAEGVATASGKIRFMFMARASDASIGLRADQTNNGTIVWDNVSVRKVDLCNPLTLVNANDCWWSTVGAENRDVYVFDGVDDRAQLTYRAINPDGDNTYEFYTSDNLVGFKTILSQNINSPTNAREFHLYLDGSSLAIIRGGVLTQITSIDIKLKPSTKYGLTQIGDTVSLFEGGLNGIPVTSVIAASGTVREPTASTFISVRSSGVGSYATYYSGIQRDIKINGVLYKMDDRNQTVQLPEPLGLGTEIFNNATATVSGSATASDDFFTFNVTAGEAAIVRTPSNSLTANTDYLLELEIFDYVAGNIANNTNGFVNVSNGAGKFRQVFNTGASTRLTLGRSGSVCNFKVRNISLKPLTVVNATELVTNGDFSSGTANWLAGGSATFSVTSGQATVGYTAGQTSRIEQSRTIEAGSYYELTATAVSISGLSGVFLQVLRGVAGSYATVAETSLNTTGQLRLVFLAPATDAIIRLRTNDTANSGTIVWDNVSLRKLDSLCNPMQLINTTSDRWREIDDI